MMGGNYKMVIIAPLPNTPPPPSNVIISLSPSPPGSRQLINSMASKPINIRWIRTGFEKNYV